MRTALLCIIRLYWKMIPEHKRRACLFEESCSQFVYRITREDGLKKGLLALKSRFYSCRPGYTLMKNESSGIFEMHLKNGRIIKENEVSSRLMPINNNYTVKNNQ